MAARRAVCYIGGKLAELPDGDTLLGASGGGGDFSSGDKLIAAQTTAPVGWTKDTTHDNKALRLVSGSVSAGGSSPFTSVFASRTPTGTVSAVSLSTAQLAPHDHTLAKGSGSTVSVPNTVNRSALGGSTTGPAFTVSSAGSGSTHDHTFSGSAMDFAVAYVDVIIIVKD